MEENISPVFQVNTLGGMSSASSPQSIIRVIGVGGAGCNTVNYMHTVGIKDVTFVVCNTDLQALDNSPVNVKVQLGKTLAGGLGAGNNPRSGREAAVESLEDIKSVLVGAKMIFITAGMGGGTGTGAAPVIAKTAKDMGILTIGVVSIPFLFEGKPRINEAIKGIDNLRECVDSLLIINSQRLIDLYGDLKMTDALDKANQVLTTATKGIAEMISRHRLINVDLADVRTAMSDSGTAIMGTGRASGENRATDALQEALRSPLLNFNDITGARHILLNITCSKRNELSQSETGLVLKTLQEYCHNDNQSNIIWGFGCDDRDEEEIEGDDWVEITVVATGFSNDQMIDKEKRAISVNISDNGMIENGGDEEKSETIKLSVTNLDTEKKAEFYYSDKQPLRYKSTATLNETTVLPLEKLEEEEVIMHIEEMPAYERRGK